MEWGPISVSPGQGAYVIAVLEAVYWYSHPVYVWEYAHSYPTSPYCAFGWIKPRTRNDQVQAPVWPRRGPDAGARAGCDACACLG